MVTFKAYIYAQKHSNLQSDLDNSLDRHGDHFYLGSLTRHVHQGELLFLASIPQQVNSCFQSWLIWRKRQANRWIASVDMIWAQSFSQIPKPEWKKKEKERETHSTPNAPKISVPGETLQDSGGWKKRLYIWKHLES